MDSIEYENIGEYYSDIMFNIINPGKPNLMINVDGFAVKELPPKTKIRIKVLKQEKSENITIGNALEHDICTFIKNDKLFYPRFLQYSNFPKSCPIPLQKYTMTNYTISAKDFPPILPAGKILLVFELINNNSVLFKIYIYARIVNI